MNIYEKLLNIQLALKAPKSQYNTFGKYNYRNCEDILEAAKPVCSKVNAAILLTDEVVTIGDRYYVKATAMLIDTEQPGTPIATCAYAREEADKKGMDGSQVTGSSSSYARKYALNGLFCIDDTKDSDSTNDGQPKPGNKPQPNAKAHDVLPAHPAPPAPIAPEPPRAVTSLPADVCPRCKKKVPTTYSEKLKKQLTGPEIIAAYGGICSTCYFKAKEEAAKASEQ